MSEEKNISIEQGDTVRFVVPVLNNDSSTQKFINDFSGYKIEFAFSPGPQLEPILTSDDVEINITKFRDTLLTEDDFPELDSISNTQPVISVKIPHSATENLYPIEGTYQIRMLNTARNEKISILSGEMTLEATPLQ